MWLAESARPDHLTSGANDAAWSRSSWRYPRLRPIRPVGISQMHVSRLIRRSLDKVREEIAVADESGS